MKFAIVCCIALCATSLVFAVAGTYFRTNSNTISLPVSSTDTIILSVSVPAGNWAIDAVIPVDDQADALGIATCDILVNGDSLIEESVTDGENGTGSAQMTIIGAVKTTTSATTISLGCRDGANTGNQKIAPTSALRVSTTYPLK
jgi:hypothetical protein